MWSCQGSKEVWSEHQPENDGSAVSICVIRHVPRADSHDRRYTLNTVDKFLAACCLEIRISACDDIARRIGAASAAFGRLEYRLWKSHDIKPSTKVAVYNAVVLTSLLHGCESWTLYRHHIRSLDKFHLRCLRHIARIKWQDKVPNTEVLQRCNTTSIEANHALSIALVWSPYTHARSQNSEIVFYSELQQSSRPGGRPKKRYKDSLKDNLRSTGIDINCWESTAASRSTWRATSAQE